MARITSCRVAALSQWAICECLTAFRQLLKIGRPKALLFVVQLARGAR